jgi:peptide/nickel transport system permease protein
VAAPIVDAAVVPPPVGAIQGRSLGQLAWKRIRRDRVAVASAIIITLLVFMAVFAPVIVGSLGHPPNIGDHDLLDPNLQVPTGSFGGISREHLLGVDPVFGRDVFSRLVYGARISLLVAGLATVVQVVLGVVFGMLAGYLGGRVDSLISASMNLLFAFPQLLFAISIAVVADGVDPILKLIFLIGFFNWPYIGRIVRGQVLSLREKEFVEAARSVGASGPRIMFREILPSLAGPLLVYSTLVIPQNILFEAALSFLGVGVNEPTASWGGMLSDAVSYSQVDPMIMVIPGVAIFITVLAFNLFGDALGDALNPRRGS